MAEQRVGALKHSHIARKIISAMILRLINKFNDMVIPTVRAHYGEKQCRPGAKLDELFGHVTAEMYGQIVAGQRILGGLISNAIETQLICMQNLIQALNEDLQTALFLLGGSATPENVTHVFPILGETHDNGYAPFLFYVDNQPALVLKFRDGTVEEKVSLFIHSELLALGLERPPRPKYFLSRDWSWSRWARHSDIEPNSYYLQAGMLSAFLLALGVSDVHGENLIVTANGPQVIDLETAFHPTPIGGAWNIFFSGLMPSTIFVNDNGSLYELAGFPGSIVNGSEEGKVVDRARVRADGSDISPRNFAEAFAKGLALASERILADKTKYEAFVDECSELRTRIIIRPTRGYAKIIEESYNPLLLQESHARADYIRSCLTYGEGNTRSDSLINAEVDALLCGDVPKFSGTPASCMVKSVHSEETELMGMTPGRENARGYISSLSQDSITAEIFRVKCVFSAAAALDQAHRASAPNLSRSPAAPSSDSARSGIALRATAREFVSSYLEQSGEVYCYQLRGAKVFDFLPVSEDLFGGASGLALAASRLKEILSENTLSLFIEQIHSKLLRRVTEGVPLGGAYVGALSAVAGLSASKMDSRIGHDLHEVVHERILSSKHSDYFGFDLVGGVAGALIVCQLLAHRHNSRRWEKCADHLFEMLISAGISDGNVRIFPAYRGLSKHPQKGLSGLSHGQAGIAYAIGLYSHLRGTKSHDLALEALRFEAENYDPLSRAFPDFRMTAPSMFNPESFGTWAHGGPGIALSVAFLSKLFGSSFNELFKNVDFFSTKSSIEEIRPSLDPSLAAGIGGLVCILGRLAPLNAAASVINATSSLKTSLKHHLSICRPGLMEGLGGMLLIEAAVKSKDFSLVPLLPHEIFM